MQAFLMACGAGLIVGGALAMASDPALRRSQPSPYAPSRGRHALHIVIRLGLMLAGVALLLWGWRGAV